MVWLWESAERIASAYGVDPRIYVGLVLVTIPPFYFAFAVVIRELLRTRDGGRVSLARAFRGRVFVVALVAMAAVWLVPYIYVALWGRNLPVWAVVSFVALMAVGVANTVRGVRKRTKSTEPSP